MSGDKSYHIVRSEEEFDKAMKDHGFMVWLKEFEPAWKSEFWDRNIVQMHFAFLAGRDPKYMTYLIDPARWELGSGTIVDETDFKDPHAKMEKCWGCGYEVYVEVPFDNTPVYCENCDE